MRLVEAVVVGVAAWAALAWFDHSLDYGWAGKVCGWAGDMIAKLIIPRDD